MRRDKGATVGLVICFVAMIAIVGAITFSNYQRKSDKEPTKTEEKAEIEKKDTDEDEETQITQGHQVQAEVIKDDNPVVSDEPGISTPITEAPIAEKQFSFSDTEVLTWPIDGNVLLSYNMEETIYFATLDQYKYNPALVISGKVGQEVKAAEEGKVTSIVTDAQTGITITVSIGDGYEAVYGQLGEVCVSQGETISQGEIIGYLGEPTKYYSVEGCNLYFQLLKDGEPMNPLEYLDV